MFRVTRWSLQPKLHVINETVCITKTNMSTRQFKMENTIPTEHTMNKEQLCEYMDTQQTHSHKHTRRHAETITQKSNSPSCQQWQLETTQQQINVLICSVLKNKEKKQIQQCKEYCLTTKHVSPISISSHTYTRTRHGHMTSLAL